MKIDTYNQNGEKVGQTLLPKEIFGVELNSDLLHQVVQAYMANRRQVSAHTKTRGDVRGGGKKPWKQKGTGRARHGSIRSPIWVGGGVAHGPKKERNFKQKINKKMARKALFMALSGKAKDGEILILEDLKLEQPKTKEMASIISKIKNKITNIDKSTLLVLPKKDENIIRAAGNLSYLDTMIAQNLNALDVLSRKYLLTTKEGIKKMKEVFSPTAD